MSSKDMIVCVFTTLLSRSYLMRKKKCEKYKRPTKPKTDSSQEPRSRAELHNQKVQLLEQALRGTMKICEEQGL
jgi:hypothetical protein